MLVDTDYLHIKNGITNYYRCNDIANISKKRKKIVIKKIALNSHFIYVY